MPATETEIGLEEPADLRVSYWTLGLAAAIMIPLVFLGVTNKFSREQFRVSTPPAVRDFGLSELVYTSNVSPTADNFFKLGFAYQERGLLEEAIVAYKKSIALDPNHKVAYNNIGVSFGGLGQWSEQIKACERALEIDPGYELARNNLAYAQRQLKR